jgi:hypothetical protein
VRASCYVSPPPAPSLSASVYRAIATIKPALAGRTWDEMKSAWKEKSGGLAARPLQTRGHDGGRGLAAGQEMAPPALAPNTAAPQKAAHDVTNMALAGTAIHCTALHLNLAIIVL